MSSVVAQSAVRATHSAAREASKDLEAVWVIIPVRDEKASLPLVLADIPADVGNVIVVDNGSRDGSGDVARAHDAHVVRENAPGYGSACLAALAEIQRLVTGGETPPRIVVFLDGDYSDHPDRLAYLAAPILEDRADLVLGSRILGPREPGAMPPQALFGNKLACFLMRLFWNADYTDLGPFRAIDYRSLEAIGMEDRNFGWTVEMQIKAIAAGLRVMEIPVPYRRRIGKSKISGTISGSVKAGAKILFTIAKYGWKTRRRQRPSKRTQ